MYTGAQPEVHGIRKYEKPVIRIDTLWDALVRAGKKAAIVADNKCSMGKLDAYDDCEEAVMACGTLAGRIKWEGDNISIHGNSAIAQVKLTLPADFGEICDLALSDVMKTVDGGSERDPAELLASAIRKRAGNAGYTQLSVEVSMTKVNNKWYIVQSLGINHVISDIRTPVASAYSMIGR